MNMDRSHWRTALRYGWAAPNTVLGLALALPALWRGRIGLVDGVVEAHGPILNWALRRLILLPGGAAAITFGHVVLGASESALEATRPHERVHVAQYERWGVFFIPAYLAASLWAWLTGGDAYRDNLFERGACQPEGTNACHGSAGQAQQRVERRRNVT